MTVSPLTDSERAFYLSQLVGVDVNTPLVDLERLYYLKNINDNIIPVGAGESVQDAIDAEKDVQTAELQRRLKLKFDKANAMMAAP